MLPKLARLYTYRSVVAAGTDLYYMLHSRYCNKFSMLYIHIYALLEGN